MPLYGETPATSICDQGFSIALSESVGVVYLKVPFSACWIMV